MRVCVPIEFKPEGGGQYFLQQLRAFLDTHGHSTTVDVTARYDVLFTNHWLVPLHVLFKGIRRNASVRIVQRIDGSARDYGRAGDADQRQHEVNRLADLTIFQSEYCRWSTRQKFPVIGQDGPVIHNPVDLDRFTPHGPRRRWEAAIRIAVVSWSTNPKKGAARVYEVARQHRDIDFFLCGRFPEAPSMPNLHPLGVLDREQLPVALRSCHALATFSENEACPNHVLEALASGLPVLYGDSGAMREVVADCGLAVIEETFGERVQQMAADWSGWSLRSRGRAEQHFNPATVFPRYVAAIEGARQAATRVPVAARLLMALGGRAAAWAVARRRWDARVAGVIA